MIIEKVRQKYENRIGKLTAECMIMLRKCVEITRHKVVLPACLSVCLPTSERVGGVSITDKTCKETLTAHSVSVAGL